MSDSILFIVNTAGARGLPCADGLAFASTSLPYIAGGGGRCSWAWKAVQPRFQAKLAAAGYKVSASCQPGGSTLGIEQRVQSGLVGVGSSEHTNIAA
jgi:hypothetical protein